MTLGTKYSGKAPLVVGAALVAAVLMVLLPLAGCDTNSGSGGNTTTQQAGTGTGGTGGGTTGSGTGENVGTGQNPPATPTYTVIFNANGGSEVASQTVESGKTATAPAKPARAGWTFLAWCSDSALTTEYSFAAAVTANTTLYAKWGQPTQTAGEAAVVVDSTGTELGRPSSLAEALTTASGSAGSTVYLVANAGVHGLSVASGSFTLDLNGKTITLASMNDSASVTVAPQLAISQGASLVVQDSSSGGTGTVTTNGGADNLLANDGNLTIRGGTFGGDMGGVQNTGTLTVTGGSISGRNLGINNESTGTVTISGGSISGNIIGGVRTAGTLYLSGNPSINDGAASFFLENSAIITLVGVLTGNAGYTLASTGGEIGTTWAVVKGGSLEAAGTPYQMTEADAQKFTTASSSDTLSFDKAGNAINYISGSGN